MARLSRTKNKHIIGESKVRGAREKAIFNDILGGFS
jgi:hypothetical protein